MQIILRGKKVRTTVITKSLSKTEVDHYRPSTMRENNTPSTSGAVSFLSLLRITHFYYPTPVTTVLTNDMQNEYEDTIVNINHRPRVWKQGVYCRKLQRRCKAELTITLRHHKGGRE